MFFPAVKISNLATGQKDADYEDGQRLRQTTRKRAQKSTGPKPIFWEHDQDHAARHHQIFSGDLKM